MKVKAGAYHAIEIKNQQRSLVLKCKNAHQQREWYERIQHMLNETVSIFIARSCFRSAPMRQDEPVSCANGM